MNPYATSKDPVWHRWVDGLVILAIGAAIGVITAQVFLAYEVETTTIKTIRRMPSPESTQNGTVEAPETPVKFEEI